MIHESRNFQFRLRDLFWITAWVAALIWVIISDSWVSDVAVVIAAGIATIYSRWQDLRDYDWPKRSDE